MKKIETYHNFSKDVLDIFEQMKATKQSSVHHAEGDVYTHTNMVVSEIEKIKNKHVDIFDQSMRIQLSKLPSNNESVKIGISLYKIFPEARDAKRERI